jgi:hypothetical protein
LVEGGEDDEKVESQEETARSGECFARRWLRAVSLYRWATIRGPAKDTLDGLIGRVRDIEACYQRTAQFCSGPGYRVV